MIWDDPRVLLSLTFVGGMIVGVGLDWLRVSIRRRDTAAVIRKLREDAEQDATRTKQEAEVRIKGELFQRRETFEAEMAEVRRDLKEQERRITKREDALERRDDLLEKREAHVEGREAKLLDREKELDRLREDAAALVDMQNDRLEELGSLTAEEARAQLLDRVHETIRAEEATLHARMQQRLEEQAEERAHYVVSQAVHRIAAEHTTEHTATTIPLPSEETKGRIIGREGRNIRTFEKAAGVDVIVDDTPGVVAVSTFDGIRREIAQRAMTKLIADGRIHPARIEEVIAATGKEIDKQITERGKQAPIDAGLSPLHPKLQHHLGRLQFRTSYGQNVLLHSIEVAHIMGILAGEIGMDVALAKRCGLLHDVGKALDQEMEGGHPEIGADLATQCKEAPEVIDAIRFHHNVGAGNTIWPVLTAAADAISASRPGARRDSIERYVQRLERLEEVALRQPGVNHAYAIQAGRELRVIVNEHEVDDEEAVLVARQIAIDIEEELTYPGEIKVTLIRERRIVEHAR